MIKEVKISNFYSIKNEVVLSFDPSSDKEYRSHYCIPVSKGVELLKLGIIYGANASGKTNILKTLDFLKRFLTIPRKSKTETTGLIPFSGMENSKNIPGKIKMTFYLDKIKYVYFLSLNQHIVLEEYLNFYPGSQPAMLFQRSFSEEKQITQIRFGNSLGFSTKVKSFIEGLTLKNSSVIAILSKANIPDNPIDRIYRWFESGFQSTIYPEADLFSKSSSHIISDPDYRDFALLVMQKADLDVQGIDIVEKEVDFHQSREENSLTGGLTIQEYDTIYQAPSLKKREVVFRHQIDGKSQYLPLELESKGTIRLFALSVPLKKVLQPGSFLMIDELENSLHNELVIHFLKMFLLNSNSSQLLVTTHNTNILNEDILRRDTIWFTEKDEKGNTELYSLLDFRLHKNINPFHAYKTGKLGAKPITGDPLINS